MSNIGRTHITDDVEISKLQCHGDYVLVEVYDRTRTSGGLHLVEGKGTECMIGKVLSVGKELPNSYDGKGYPIGIEVGEEILTMEYVGERMVNEHGTFRFLHAHGVWAKVKLRDRASFDIKEIEPCFAFMLVEPIDDEVTKGGIYLAQGHDAQENMRKAKIIKVGPGQWDARTGKRIPLPFEAGDGILMLRYAGADVTVNGKKLRLIDYADVKCGWEG